MNAIVKIRAEPPVQVESSLCARFRCTKSQCAACAIVCPVPGAVRFVEQGVEITEACVACGACASACPNGALRPLEGDRRLAERIRDRVRPAAAFRHGVLLPSFFFSQLACGCDRCGSAFDAALPGWRQLDDPTAVVGVPASSSCSNCGSTLQPSSGSKSYFCLTCELENQGGDSYVLCQTCYDVRGSSGSAAAVMHDPQHILQEETVENLWSVMGTLIALHHHDDQERGPPRAPTPPARRTGADSLAAHTTGWIAAARETQARVLSECLAAVEGVTVKVAAPPAAGSTAGRKRPRPAAGSSRSSSSSPETPPPGDNGSQ